MREWNTREVEYWSIGVLGKPTPNILRRYHPRSVLFYRTNTPSLHHSITPLLHRSITPIFICCSTDID